MKRNIIGGAFTLASLMLAGMHWQKMVLFTSSVKLSTLLVKLPPIQPIKLSHWVKSVKMHFQV